MSRLLLTTASLVCLAALFCTTAIAKTREEKQKASQEKQDRKQDKREAEEARRAQTRADKQAAATQKADKAAERKAAEDAKKAEKSGKSGKSDKASRNTTTAAATTQPIAPRPITGNTGVVAPRRAAQLPQTPGSTTAPTRKQGSVFQTTMEQKQREMERAKAQQAPSAEFESSNEYKAE